MKRSVIDSVIDSGLIKENALIILGLSGGPDSLCLLHILNRLTDVYNLTIIPVHINHRLRAEAESEAENVVRICDRMGLDCNVFETDCAALAEDLKVSTEEAGRLIRYEIFDDVANDLAAQGIDPDNIAIALAHNADDQSETVLFRLLRGTGIHGLAGIPAFRISDGGYAIIRPLLTVERCEIEAYITENNLHPNIDSSNATNEYTRNRIRNELIPYLEKNYNPSVKEALRKYAEIAELDDMVMSDIAFSEFDENISVNSDDEVLILQLTELRDNPVAVNRRIIGFVLKTLDLEADTGYGHILSVLDLIYSDNPSASIDLPHGFRAIREYDRMLFTDNEKFFSISEADESLDLRTKIIKRREYELSGDQLCAAFDFDLFNEKYPGRAGDIVLRKRQEGDFIALKDGGRKKIQDLLVDDKIRKNVRDSLLMACIDNEVLWIIPNSELATERQREKGRFSQNFHIEDSCERVLFLEVIEHL